MTIKKIWRKRKMNKIDNATLIYLKKWASELAFEIYQANLPEFYIDKHDDQGTILVLSGSGQNKMKSIILESMSTSKVWKNAK